jgi:hypothetical protein
MGSRFTARYRPFVVAVVVSIGLAYSFAPAKAAEVAILNERNWDALAPRGKEVDAIYGDFVLRNDRVVAVVANPVRGRHANLRARDVGGGLIDLTQRMAPNDQLTLLYPAPGASLQLVECRANGARCELHPEEAASGRDVEIVLRGTPRDARAKASVEMEVVYRLADGEEGLVVTTKFRNLANRSVVVRQRDEIVCDGEFQIATDAERKVFVAHDRFWRQAYAVAPETEIVSYRPPAQGAKKTPRLCYGAPTDRIELAAGQSRSLVRRVFSAADAVAVKALVARQRGQELGEVSVAVKDSQGGVADADVVVVASGESIYGAARCDSQGNLAMALPAGEYRVETSHQSRGGATNDVVVTPGQRTSMTLQLPAAGQVKGTVVDGRGEPIPCKADFAPQDGGAAPNFGPDSAEYGVRNLVYAPDGKFRVTVRPGKYNVLVSHGPEYDAVAQDVEVVAGKETALEVRLNRTVDTRGWLSAEYHSHSSPSGDNTASQLGRVLNLVAEHLEFIPCTEHNRIDSYDEALAVLQASGRALTCSGIELTGQPLPINHQNAFPLIHRPRTQNGGGPETDVDPVVQIERLAMWDDASDKLVQSNHPNIPQMLGDRDLDGRPDGGFERMFSLMDVVEVHPLADVFSRPDRLPPRSGDVRHAMFHWLQLLNRGYRVTGVVNTDAHWNFHGSGSLRNFVRSTTDDPAKANVMDLVHASEAGRLVMTNGPFLEVTATASDGKSCGVGEDLRAADGAVKLAVRVQCPNWIDVNRVQVFVNGRAAENLNFLRGERPELYRGGVVKFDQSLDVSLASDAHLVVAVIGEGLSLGRVMGPDNGPLAPIAVANPVYVDVDGGGFQVNGDDLGLPLPVAAPPMRVSYGDHQHH